MEEKKSKRCSIKKYITEKKEEGQHLGDLFYDIEEVIANNPELTAKGAYGYLRTPAKNWTSEGISKYLAFRTSRTVIPNLVEILEIEKFEKNKNPAILCRLEYNDKKTDLWMNSVLMFTQKEYRGRVNKILKEARKKHRKDANEHQS